MKILVRLPNWLGDMVMAAGFIERLHSAYPDASIDVIAKKGIHELLPFFPHINKQYIFSKTDYPGLKGLWNFGSMIRRENKYDIFFCLPDSFSSALMGKATGSIQRIGYRNELRNFLMTKSFAKPKGMHRVEEYLYLLEQFSGRAQVLEGVHLYHDLKRSDHIVVNINSEASSRRLTKEKAVELVEELREQLPNRILLIGGPKEKDFVENVLSSLKDQRNIESVAGKTSLQDLVSILATAELMLTTDSGPAHLSNALGTYTIVLFGAGNENNTAPYNKETRTVIRLGKLSCEPCTKNTCIQFGIPQCLELLDTRMIVNEAAQKIKA